MHSLEDIFYDMIALWITIILFLTAPLWGVPYLVYKAIKNRKG